MTLRHTPDGSPCGTLRAVGKQNEKAFEGWIGLIGVITEEDLIAGDDKTVARVKATATHRGEFMGLPPTRKERTCGLNSSRCD